MKAEENPVAVTCSGTFAAVSRCFLFSFPLLIRFESYCSTSARFGKDSKTFWNGGEMDDPWADPAKAASQTGLIVL